MPSWIGHHAGGGVAVVAVEGVKALLAHLRGRRVSFRPRVCVWVCVGVCCWFVCLDGVPVPSHVLRRSFGPHKLGQGGEVSAWMALRTVCLCVTTLFYFGSRESVFTTSILWLPLLGMLGPFGAPSWHASIWQ
jgi:hypothetical protein